MIFFSFLNDQATQQMMQSDFQCVSLSGEKGRFFFIPLRINKISMGSLNSIFHSLLEVLLNNLTHNIKNHWFFTSIASICRLSHSSFNCRIFTVCDNFNNHVKTLMHSMRVKMTQFDMIMNDFVWRSKKLNRNTRSVGNLPSSIHSAISYNTFIRIKCPFAKNKEEKKFSCNPHQKSPAVEHKNTSHDFF